jgi:hypothetical protein
MAGFRHDDDHVRVTPTARHIPIWLSLSYFLRLSLIHSILMAIALSGQLVQQVMVKSSEPERKFSSVKCYFKGSSFK